MSNSGTLKEKRNNAVKSNGALKKIGWSYRRFAKSFATSGILAAVLAMLVGSSFLLLTPFASTTIAGYKVLCPSLPNGDFAGGIYSATGGAFVEDWSNGNLVFCGSGHSKTIATAPAGGESASYYGLGGVQTKSGVVLALTTAGLQGFWLCKHATPSGCESKSQLHPVTRQFLCLRIGGTLQSAGECYR